MVAMHKQAAGGRVEPWQRFTNRNTYCPICEGSADDRRGQGIRCPGYFSKDERYAFCTREQYAGNLERNEHTTPPTYKHKLDGPCNCGRTHGAAEERPMPAREPDREAKALGVSVDELRGKAS